MNIREFFTKLYQFSQNAVVFVLIMAHIVFIGVLAVRMLGQLEQLELNAYAYSLKVESASVKPDERITMLWLTDEEQRLFGNPLPDKQLARALEILLENKARIIGLDIYRDLPVPIEGGKDYEKLYEILHDSDNIIAIQKLINEYGARVDPPPAMLNTNRVGFNDFLADAPNGIVRRGILWMGSDGRTYESFALQIAMRYLRQDKIYLQNLDDGGCCRFNDKPLPSPLLSDEGGYVNVDADGYQFLMTYPAAPLEFNSIMLASLLSGDFDKRMIENKIIIIGNRSEATPDFFYTPVDDWRMAGAAIHAYSVSQILHWAEGKSMPPRGLDEHWEVAWIWLWTIMGALGCLWARAVWRFALLTLGGLILLAGCFHYFFAAGWWLLFAAPALGWIVSTTMTVAYLSYRERNQRGALMNIFSRYVSKDVAQVIWDSREQYLSNGRLKSQRLTATVLFTDLQNFTSISEGMEPQELMDWLNEYMEAMVHVVETHDGQINKFIGDAVMAIFGVPIASESEEEIAQDARNAVDCALAMGKELERLREKWIADGLPRVKMRVGIFTGPLVAGSLGGIERQEYTVIGDTVNTAARLESFDKTLGMESSCRVLIGDSTLKMLGDEFETHQIGEVQLKGKSELVTIHQVNARIEKASDADNSQPGIVKSSVCDGFKDSQHRLSAM